MEHIFLQNDNNTQKNKKYDNICNKEKTDLSICMNSNENKDCDVYEKLYNNCIDFKKQKGIKEKK